jgi:hypothetical protein
MKWDFGDRKTAILRLPMIAAMALPKERENKEGWMVGRAAGWEAGEKAGRPYPRSRRNYKYVPTRGRRGGTV